MMIIITEIMRISIIKCREVIDMLSTIISDDLYGRYLEDIIGRETALSIIIIAEDIGLKHKGWESSSSLL